MYMHIVYIQYTLCEVLNEVPTNRSDVRLNLRLTRDFLMIYRMNIRTFTAISFAAWYLWIKWCR